MSGIADSPPAQKVRHREAGKIAYVDKSHLRSAAALEEVNVREERDGDMDVSAPMGRPGKRLVRILVWPIDPDPQPIDMGRGSECTPRVSDEAIALEGTERRIAARYRVLNEIGM